MPLTYFLKIDGIAGDSTSKGHEGWFELSSQQLGFGRGISSFNSGDRTVGSVSFSELTATLTGDAGLAKLLSGLTSSKAISAVEIEGVSGSGKSAQTVYDLKLNDVLVSGVSLSSGSEGPSGVSFSLNYGKIGLITTGTTANGAAVVETFGWDLETNQSIDPATLHEAGSNQPVLVPEDLVYFLKIDGIAGDSTSKGHEGWFELSSQQLGFGRGISSFNGGERSAGEPSFSDVTLVMAGDSGLAELLGEVTNSKAISTVEIEGVKGSNGELVIDLRFDDVLLSGLRYSGSGDGELSYKVDLNYTGMAIKTFGEGPGGTPVIDQFIWDPSQAAQSSSVQLSAFLLTNEPEVRLSISDYASSSGTVFA